MTTEFVRWQREIRDAVSETDPARCNRRITLVHHRLGLALRDRLGPETGANFHAWATWGSRKAGVTIRQEDLDGALRDASLVAGIVGGAVGTAVAEGARRGTADSLRRARLPLLGAAGLAAGTLLGRACGAAAGRAIAAHSRREASRLILEGNRTVLEDIGTHSARFLAAFSGKAPDDRAALAAFLDGFRPGRTADGGEDLLRAAFAEYHRALCPGDPAARRMAACRANCLAVLHEHVRLEPYIRGSLPWIVRRCVTERMMTFDVGGVRLAVGRGVPATASDLPSVFAVPGDATAAEWRDTLDACRRLPETGADDWTDIRQRMRYIFELFRAFHDEPSVFAAP